MPRIVKGRRRAQVAHLLVAILILAAAAGGSVALGQLLGFILRLG